MLILDLLNFGLNDGLIQAFVNVNGKITIIEPSRVIDLPELFG